MRLKTLPVIIGLAVVAVLGTAGATSGTAMAAKPKPPPITLEHIPYCAPGADLCIEIMGVHSTGTGHVLSTTRLKTVHKPKTLEIKLWLYLKTRTGWVIEDEETYGKKELAEPGHSRNMRLWRRTSAAPIP